MINWCPTSYGFNAMVGPKQTEITIERRPGYCDRGNYIAKTWYDPVTGFPLDGQEGWPRYYFDLERAKAEIEDWVDARVRRG